MCEIGASKIGIQGSGSVTTVKSETSNNDCCLVEAYVKFSEKYSCSAIVMVAIQPSIAVSSSNRLSEIDDESGKRWVAVRDVLASAPVLSRILRWVSMLS